VGNAKENIEPVWLRIPEYSEMRSADVYTWRRLAWRPGGEFGMENDKQGSFDIYLAIDAKDKKNQSYKTQTLTVELLII
jgi:hypothetical protein